MQWRTEIEGIGGIVIIAVFWITGAADEVTAVIWIASSRATDDLAMTRLRWEISVTLIINGIVWSLKDLTAGKVFVILTYIGQEAITIMC